MALALERNLRVRRRDTSELRPLAGWIQEFAARRGLSAAATYDLDLGLHEAVANIIQHGCEEGREHRIRIRLEAAEEAIRIRIEDDARPFNPLEVPAPTVPASLEETPAGGRGLPLLRLLMRELRYEHAGGHNILTLLFVPD